MNQKKKLDTRKLEKQLNQLKQFEKRKPNLSLDSLDTSGLQKALERAKNQASAESGYTGTGMLPVAPRDFVPKDKSDRRRIPSRVRATFEERRKEA
jgi:hypothetical protein